MGIADKVLEESLTKNALSSLTDEEKKTVEEQIKQISKPFDQLGEAATTALSKPGALDALRQELLRIKAGS